MISGCGRNARIRGLGRVLRTHRSRSQLERDPKFLRAFERAKERVRRMEVRFVEEADPLKQALLEIYVAVALHTRDNNFDTH